MFELLTRRFGVQNAGLQFREVVNTRLTGGSFEDHIHKSYANSLFLKDVFRVEKCIWSVSAYAVYSFFGYQRKSCVKYLDDIIIFARDAETHITDVADILAALKRVGVSLKLNNAGSLSRTLSA